MEVIWLLVIAHCFLNSVDAVFNKEVVCIMDPGEKPVCKVTSPIKRRNDGDPATKPLPTFDPYIPEKFEIFYNCTGLLCKNLFLNSLTQITDPEALIKGCYKTKDKYECSNIRYHHLKNVDRLLFLNSHIKDKSFYVADCLVYRDGGRVCHRKDDTDTSHVKLIDTGTIVRPNETNILSQGEFVCEESSEGDVNCDIAPFVSFDDKLVIKEVLTGNEKVLLKTGNYVVPLKKNCIENWCGYSGQIVKSLRRWGYEPPGGKVYRCYYAKKQQICKRIPSRDMFFRGILNGYGEPFNI